MREICYEVAVLLLKLVERCFRALILFKIVKAHARAQTLCREEFTEAVGMKFI
jgi:hypothetical protein